MRDNGAQVPLTIEQRQQREILVIDSEQIERIEERPTLVSKHQAVEITSGVLV